MEFADPKSDIAFKKLFADQKHSNILISFLNSILNRKKNRRIIKVKIIDPNNQPEIKKHKFSILDVHCIDESGKNYIVEMQVANEYDFLFRSQFYSSLVLSRQLKKGENYNLLKPVIYLGIVNFNLLPGNKECLTHHFTLCDSNQKQYLNLFEHHFVELKKFKKDLAGIKTLSDKWIYLLKNASDLDKAPRKLTKEQDIESAFEILNTATWNKKEHERYFRYVDGIRVEQSVIETAEMEGVEKGRKEGREEGRENEKIKIAQQLLDILDDKTIAKKIGLSIEIIKKLRKST